MQRGDCVRIVSGKPWRPYAGHVGELLRFGRSPYGCKVKVNCATHTRINVTLNYHAEELELVDSAKPTG